MPNDKSWNTVAASPAERVAQNINLTARYRDLPIPEITQVADSTTSITIELTSPSDSDAVYFLYCSVDGGAPEIVSGTDGLPASAFPYKRENLTPGAYRHEIFARNPHMDTDFFTVQTAVTLEGELPSGDGPVLSVTGVSRTERQVDIVDAAGATQLKLEWAPTAEGPWRAIKLDPDLVAGFRHVNQAPARAGYYRAIDRMDPEAVYGPIASASTLGPVAAQPLTTDEIVLSAGSYGPGPEVFGWSDFDDLPAGSEINGAPTKAGTKTAFSTQLSTPGLITVDDTHCYAGNRSVKVTWADDNRSGFGLGGMDTDELRMSFRAWQSFLSDPAVNDNTKLFFLFGTNDSWPQVMVLVPEGSGDWKVYNNVSSSSVNTMNTKIGSLDKYDPDDEWRLWDIYIKRNSAVGVHDGIFQIWVDGQLLLDIPNYCFVAVPEHDGNFNSLSLGSYMRGLRETIMWFDELYQARGRQCIYLSTSPTWDDSAPQDIAVQVPKSWSDTEIRFDRYMSALPTDVPLYAHVRKADGTMAAAEQVYTP